MHRTHSKIHYVGGLVSLILLPIFLYVSLTAVSQKAVFTASIQVQMAPGDFYDPVASSTPESTYVFLGNTETTKLYNFQTFCEQSKIVSKVERKVHLPSKCSYELFIHVIDILQRNNFMCEIRQRTIQFRYRPQMTFQQEYEPLSLAEEMQYVYLELSERLSERLSSLERYLSEEPIYTIRILKYSDLVPHPVMGGPGTAAFTPKDKIKEPQSKILFETLGFWFLPIISSWFILLVLSVKKCRGNIVA